MALPDVQQPGETYGNTPPPTDDWFDQQGSPDAPAPTAGQTATPAPQSNLPGGDQRAAVEAFIANWQRTHDPHEGIAGLTQALAQQFPGTVTPYLYGNTPSNNEINLGGEKYKVLGGEGGPAAYWYIPGTNDMGGPEGDGGGWGRLGGGTGSLAGIAAEALTTSPGYQFRLGEGMKALERSAASKGTLLTGGTLKGLTRFAQDYASGEYGQNYARLFGEQGARYNQLYGLSQLGLNAAGQSASGSSSYANQVGNLNTNQANTGSDLITGGANAGAAGTIGQSDAIRQAINDAVKNALTVYGISKM